MRRPLPHRQEGIALVVFIIIVALATFSYFMSTITPEQIELDRQVKTQQALQRARTALLAYAMNYPDFAGNPNQGPGNLPCPDRDNDGLADNNNCNNNLNSPGRLPFDTLDIDEIRDGHGESLWYAASNSFVTWGDPQINTSTTGRISIRNSAGAVINDAAGIDGVIAVIISPGETIAREDGVLQSRRTAAQRINPVNYMDIAFAGTPAEEDNAGFLNGDSNDGLVSGTVTDAAGNVIVNDVIETITWSDMFEYLHARVASDMFDAIRGHRAAAACNEWPWAMAFDPTLGDGEFGDDVPAGEDPVQNQGSFRVDDTNWGAVGCAAGLLPAWFAAEDWHRNTYYAVNAPVTADCVAPACLRTDLSLPPPANFTKQAVLVFAGRHGLPAYTANEADYFEGENDNTFNDSDYDETEPGDSVWSITP